MQIEWGFKKFLTETLKDVPLEDFPFFAREEGLNPPIYCGEGIPQKRLDTGAQEL